MYFFSGTLNFFPVLFNFFPGLFNFFLGLFFFCRFEFSARFFTSFFYVVVGLAIAFLTVNPLLTTFVLVFFCDFLISYTSCVLARFFTVVFYKVVVLAKAFFAGNPTLTTFIFICV